MDQSTAAARREEASFLVWFEDHNEAMAIGPKLAAERPTAHPFA